MLTISIVDGNALDQFYLDASAKLFFNADYDVDDASFPDTTNLTLKVTDTGLLSATTVICMQIADVNDNAPVFTSSMYVHSTSDSTVGSTLFSVSASDLDSGDNGMFTYQLNQSSPYIDTFAISSTGWILLMKSIDNYPSDHVFNFGIIVTDRGTPSLMSTSQVSLVVTRAVVSPTTASIQAQEVSVASIISRPEVLGVLAAVLACIVLMVVTNLLCWSRMASKSAKLAENSKPTSKLTE